MTGRILNSSSTYHENAPHSIVTIMVEGHFAPGIEGSSVDFEIVAPPEPPPPQPDLNVGAVTLSKE